MKTWWDKHNYKRSFQISPQTIRAGAGLIWFALPPSFHWMLWGNFRGLLGRRASKSETPANRFVPNGKAWYQMTLRGMIDRCGRCSAFRLARISWQRGFWVTGRIHASCMQMCLKHRWPPLVLSVYTKKSHDAAVFGNVYFFWLMQKLPQTPQTSVWNHTHELSTWRDQMETNSCRLQRNWCDYVSTTARLSAGTNWSDVISHHSCRENSRPQRSWLWSGLRSKVMLIYM